MAKVTSKSKVQKMHIGSPDIISGDSSKGGDLEVSDRSPDVDSVASHTASSSSNIEQDKKNRELRDGFGYEWWEG